MEVRGFRGRVVITGNGVCLGLSSGVTWMLGRDYRGREGGDEVICFCSGIRFTSCL